MADDETEEILRWIREHLDINLEGWQARWFEEGFPDHGTAFIPAAFDYAQRRASRTFYWNFLQSLELADAINRGDLAGYVKTWYPQAEAAHQPEEERSGTRVHLRGTAETAIRDNQVGFPSSRRGTDSPGADRVVRGEARIVRNNHPAPFTAASIRSGLDPAAVGEVGAERELRDAHQEGKTAQAPVLARVLRYCLLALGRILSLFDSSRGRR